MNFSKYIRQYWPLTVFTLVVILALPLISDSAGSRPGLAGINTKRVVSSYALEDLRLETPICKTIVDPKTHQIIPDPDFEKGRCEVVPANTSRDLASPDRLNAAANILEN